jgi:fermentation-respiration switch protein FrsA (DUF1100 family)
VAAYRKVGGLVIESGFLSAFRVMTGIRLLPFDRFDNLQKVGAVSCPVLVMHCREDEIIPFRHEQQLFKAVRQPKMNLWVDRAGHNDLELIAGAAYWDTLRSFEKFIDSNKPGAQN